MIEFTFKKLPVDADGKSYDSLEDFQAAALTRLLGIIDSTADDIMAHKDEIIEILELTMDARPVARGKKKPRKSKAEATPVAQPALV